MRDLLRDKRTSSAPSKEIMVHFSEKVMTSGDTSTPGVTSRDEIKKELWASTTPEEVKAALPPMHTAPGPDGLTAKQFRSAPIAIGTLFFNIFVVCGRLSHHLLESRTTLIPKKDGASEPEYFRPITISSTIARSFHKILASRMCSDVDPTGSTAEGLQTE